MIVSKKSSLNKLIKFDNAFEDKLIIGLDEAGRGPGAGDVYSGAVYFPEFTRGLRKDLKQLNDSKKLSPKLRNELAQVIKNNSVWAISVGSLEEIEKINILQSSLLSMHRAAVNVLEQINELKNPYLLVDGNKLIKNCEIEQQFVIKGDAKSASIAAASILAKTERDNYMMNLAEEYPQYDWQNNKGYLTPKHLKAIEEHGITPYHRKSFLTKQLSLLK